MDYKSNVSNNGLQNDSWVNYLPAIIFVSSIPCKWICYHFRTITIWYDINLSQSWKRKLFIMLRH